MAELTYFRLQVIQPAMFSCSLMGILRLIKLKRCADKKIKGLKRMSKIISAHNTPCVCVIRLRVLCPPLREVLELLPDCSGVPDWGSVSVRGRMTGVCVGVSVHGR